MAEFEVPVEVPETVPVDVLKLNPVGREGEIENAAAMYYEGNDSYNEEEGEY